MQLHRLGQGTTAHTRQQHARWLSVPSPRHTLQRVEAKRNFGEKLSAELLDVVTGEAADWEDVQGVARPAAVAVATPHPPQAMPETASVPVCAACQMLLASRKRVVQPERPGLVTGQHVQEKCSRERC